MALIRLDKILASSGLYSRSEAAALARKGKVTVDGLAARSGAEKFDPVKAEITVNGVLLEYRSGHYIMMNKPAGYVSATEDPRERTVVELLDERLRRAGLFPAGRLDKDSEGLLILTDDGDYAHRITSPKKAVDKLYYVETEGALTSDDADAFQNGIELMDNTRFLPARLEILSSGAASTAYVAISEGKFHQVKRMLSSRGKTVTYLKRLAIGGLTLDARLAPGEYRELTRDERDSALCMRNGDSRR